MISQGLNWMLDEAQLQALCSRLGLDMAELPGEDKQSQIKALVARFVHEKRLYQLLRAVNDRLIEAGMAVPDELKEVIASGKADLQAIRMPPARFASTCTYRIFGSGDVLLETDIQPNEGLPFLPRLGWQLRLPAGFEQVQWYGRGPHECYVDRQEGARVGVYQGTVDDQYVPYIVPEENGNKTGVRWAALTNAAGQGLLISSDRPIEFSALHYTVDELTRARHTYELAACPQIICNIDYAQSGLGSASCGPGRLEKYQLPAQPVHFTIRLRPFATATETPNLLSKQVLC
jgi:hypothetical protein